MGKLQPLEALKRIATYLDLVRELYKFDGILRCNFIEHFPQVQDRVFGFWLRGVGFRDRIQSVGLQLSERELSTLARLGSGSASQLYSWWICSMASG
jgi:hypothetical protein